MHKVRVYNEILTVIAVAVGFLLTYFGHFAAKMSCGDLKRIVQYELINAISRPSHPIISNRHIPEITRTKAQNVLERPIFQKQKKYGNSQQEFINNEFSQCQPLSTNLIKWSQIYIS